MRPTPETSPEAAQTSEKDPLEDFYDSELENVSQANNLGGPEVRSIQQQICELKHLPRLALNTDMKQVWRDKKFEKPELYELATTLLAVPSSQVSVERAFSALALVLTN